VVVFDLDPVVRHELDRQLEVLGWEAIPVDSAEDAVRIVELGFEVDILLADLEVPEMRGLEIARKVVSASPQTRIVFMASSAPIQPLDARDSPVLVKPFTAEELARTLARA
jgi:CheY-like chemotaxis protein